MESTKLPADPTVLYEAYAARDRRFDGVFLVGVASTRIYCRPICPARTARKSNCSFFIHPAQAEAAGYRPCRRCRPERAPGRSAVDMPTRLIGEVAVRMGGGSADESAQIAAVAKDLHISPRHLRRVVQRELGVSPMEMLQTHRLLLARRLLAETDLPVTDIVRASGFSSVRRFNDAFLKRYGSAPSVLRREIRTGRERRSGDSLTIELAYRPPYDWAGTLAFLEKRLMQGVEMVSGESYVRSASVGDCTGWLRVANAPATSSLRLELSASLIAVLPSIIARVRTLFDLEANPALIAAHLGIDPLLGSSVAASPGLRVPGAFDGFELALRAILGQQVTVRAAATLAGRLAAELGEQVALPVAGLERVSPTPLALAHADADRLLRLGIVRRRAEALIELARCVVEERIVLTPGRPFEDTLRDLQRIRGIGPWTAQYIAMRALAWPDAFPKEDVVLRKRLGSMTPAQAELRSHAWRPWRSYATMHLWRMAYRSP